MLRLSPLAFLALTACVLGACASGPVEVPPRDADADALLVYVAGDAWDDVFARPTSGAYDRVATLDGAATSPEAVDSIPNPLPAFLSDEPPYLDAAASDQYSTRVLGDTTVAGRAATLVEALFVADSRRTQPIRYVRAAVEPATGALLAIEVRRESESTLYDETSRLVASLASGETGLAPGTVRVETRTNVPTSPPRSESASWRQRP